MVYKSTKEDKKAAKFREIMIEFKAGKLKTSKGTQVTERSQAMAIALSEIRAMGR